MTLFLVSSRSDVCLHLYTQIGFSMFAALKAVYLFMLGRILFISLSQLLPMRERQRKTERDAHTLSHLIITLLPFTQVKWCISLIVADWPRSTDRMWITEEESWGCSSLIRSCREIYYLACCPWGAYFQQLSDKWASAVIIDEGDIQWALSEIHWSNDVWKVSSGREWNFSLHSLRGFICFGLVASDNNPNIYFRLSCLVWHFNGSLLRK